MKKSILFLLFLILSSCLVLGVKPTPTPQIGEVGLIIIYPKNPYYHKDGNLTFHYHVFNATNDLQLNVSVGITCEIHIYNGSNNHIAQDKLVLDSNGIEFKYAVPYNITNTTGTYPFLVWCNTTNGQGGFISDSFEVTNDGQEKEGGYLLAMILILLPLIFGYFMLKWCDILGEEHNVLRINLLLLSFISVIASLWLATASVVRFVNWVSMEENLTTFTLVVGGLFFAITSYFIIYMIKKIFLGINAKKEEKLDL